MEGIDWAFAETPPKAAYQSVCESDEEGAAYQARDAAFARINKGHEQQ